MITRVEIENFKAFTELALDICPLTLFTGKNGMGKSSFIQSLLMLRQSYLMDPSLSELTLNGSLVNIGYGKDLLNVYGNGPIRFEIEFDRESFVLLEFEYSATFDKLDGVRERESHERLKEIEKVSSNSLFTNNFQYLNAQRITPRRTFDASPHAVEVLKTLGNEGQYTVHFLDKYKFKPISNVGLQHVSAKSNSLLDNVDAWLSEVSSEVRVKPRFHPDLQISTLGFEFVDGMDTTPEFSSLNTGFGLTYVLPVIVAVLSAQKGDLLIVENPESHLHPQGQAVLGRLLAMAANAGVQIIVESHSDHLFNGMRVAVKQGLLDPNDFAIYFFSRDNEQYDIFVEQPLVDARGRLSYQPEGFFDEYSKQLTEIIKPV